MDMNFGKTPRFGRITGTIVELVPAGFGNRKANACVQIARLEDENGNPVNVILSPATYVVDFETLSVGKRCAFWYLADAPMPLIYPPQYSAAAAAGERNGRMIDVSFYDKDLVNSEGTLKLRLDGSVDLRTANNQYFQGSPAEHDLVVIYETSTRSIPAQTTPKKIVVLCGMSQRG